jgi:hypothetical protein
MARWPKKEAVVETIQETEKREENKVLPIERFFARYANFHFHYAVIGNDGKPAYKTNPATGNNIYDVDGNPQPILKQEKFKTVQDKMSKGFLSVAEFNPNTEDKQELERGNELRKLAAQRDIMVFTEEAYEKAENYDKWVEKQRRVEVESRLANAETKAARVDELEKRLAELEGK